MPACRLSVWKQEGAQRVFHRSQNGDRHEGSTSVSTVPDCKSRQLCMCRNYGNTHACTRPHATTTTTVKTSRPLPRVFASVCLSLCAIVTLVTPTTQRGRLALLRSTNMCSVCYKVTHTHMQSHTGEYKQRVLSQ